MKTTSLFIHTLCAISLLCVALASVSGQIVYTRVQANGVLKLHQMRANGSGDTAINLPFKQAGFPRWMPGGAQLSFTAFQPARVPTHTWNAYDVSFATGALRKLTDYHDLLDTGNPAFSYTFPWYKAFSPDRSRMATFSIVQTGGPGDGGGGVVELPVLEIHSLNRAANPVLVHVDKTQNGRHHGGEGIDWSPNEAVLAAPLESSAPFQSGGGPGEVTAIFLIAPVQSAVQQGRVRQVTFPRADSNQTTGVLMTEHDYQPRFSPNGAGLAYVRSFQSHALLTSLEPDPDIQSIHITNLNTGADRVVRTFPRGTYITTIDWSPDGTKLVFDLALQATSPVGPLQQGRPETNQIFSINADGTRLKMLRGNGNGTPSWRKR